MLRSPRPFALPIVAAELLLLAGVAASITGCDEGMMEDAVAFERMDVTDLDWTAVQSDFVFSVANPMFIDLGVARFDYTLELAGADVAFGEAADGLVVQAGGGELAFPVGLTFAEVYDLTRAEPGQDTMDFVFAGTVGFDTDWGPVDLPFEAEGDFPALRTPKVKLDSLKVDEVDWTGASLDLGLAIDNDHGSTLIFDNLDYGLTIDGFDVAGGKLAQLGSAESGKSTVALPIDVEFLDLGGAAISALTGGGQVDVGLAATADVETPFGVIPLTIDAADGLSVLD